MGLESEQHDPLQLSIPQIIQTSDVSVRLRNAIAAAEGNLPFKTIGEYLAAGSNAFEKFLSVRNLGRRSAQELDVLVRSWAEGDARLKVASVSNSTTSAPQLADIELCQRLDAAIATSTTSARQLPDSELRRHLLRLFSKLSFPQIVTEFPRSTRLNNGLLNGFIAQQRFSDFLRETGPTYGELIKIHNVGKTSVKELQALVRDILAKFLSSRALSASERDAAISLILDGTEPTAATLPALSALSNTDPFHASDAVAAQADIPLHDLVVASLKQLDERTKVVLERRYGVERTEQETLEQIASTWNVTRERVRQIEAKGLRKLSSPSRLRLIKQALKREAPAQISRAANGAAMILADSARAQIMKRLPATTRIAIDIVYRSASKGMIEQTFLRNNCTKWKNGWLLRDQSVPDLNEVLVALKAKIRQRLLPIALDELLGGMDRDLATTAIELGMKVSLFEGYVMMGRIGPRARRTVRLHARLSAAHSMQEIRNLLMPYHRIFTTDRCSVRDAEIVMSDAPHLFLRVVDENWYAIGSAPAAAESSADGEADSLSEDNEDGLFSAAEEANIRKVLRNELAKNGPLRFVELRAKCAPHLSGRSINSVGPILLTSGSFLRPLPGIYALAEQLPSSSILPFDPPAFLLSEEQARWLAMARHASEPFGLFPLWTPAAEYALCRWGQLNASRSVYRSLLAVSTIADWPVSAETQEHWLALQRRDGMYDLEYEPRYPFAQLLPPLDRLLAAAVYVQFRGGISWLSANRILKRRLDASISAGLLALMVVCGAIKPSTQWQRLHAPGPALDEIVKRLSTELHVTGTLDWHSSFGKALIDEFRTAYRGNEGGWVTQAIAEELLSAGATTKLPNAAVDEDEPMNALESLLKEHRERVQKNVIDSSLASLLD